MLKEHPGKIQLTKKIDFSAAHTYYNDSLTDEENNKIFGKCVHLHGHNYDLEVTYSGIADSETGMVVNLKDINQLLHSEIIDKLDHKNLNKDVDYFKHHIPTTENIAVYIWNELNNKLEGCELYRIRLWEDDDLYVEYYGNRACLSESSV